MHTLGKGFLLLGQADGAGLRGSRVPASSALYASFCRMPRIPTSSTARLRPAFLLPPWADIGLTRKVSVAMSPYLATHPEVSEFVHLRPEGLPLEGECQLYIQKAKKGSLRHVPLLPALAQELRLHLGGRDRGYLFESNRHHRYSPRAVQKLIQAAAEEAGISRRVYPHLLRHSVAQILLDRGMPLDQLQKFLGHKDPRTTQIYAESSLSSVTRSYRDALLSPR